MKKFFAVIFAVFVLCSSVCAVELSNPSSDNNSAEVVGKIEEISSKVSGASFVADVSSKADSSVPSDSEGPPGGNTIYVLEQPASSFPFSFFP